MTGMAAKIRLAAAVAVAALLTVLVFLSVHPDRLTSWAGVVPLAAMLWATFAAGVLLVRRIPVRWAAPLILLGGIAAQLAALPHRRWAAPTCIATSGTAGCRRRASTPTATRRARRSSSLRDRYLWPHHGPSAWLQRAPRLDGAAPGLADPGCTLINRPIVHTIYPPVAEAYFYLATWSPGRARAPPRSRPPPPSARSG